MRLVQGTGSSPSWTPTATCSSGDRQHVERALHVLRQAERASVMPDGFGDWSGQRFLHLRFTGPSATRSEMFTRLVGMVDAMGRRRLRPEGPGAGAGRHPRSGRPARFRGHDPRAGPHPARRTCPGQHLAT
ncbi:MAG: hypothetical protein ACRDYX_16680 [Egibacteraceae bacterium]